MKSMHLRQRQIHLDFHTSPAIPGVGADFDAREFARTMKRAHVNSVTVFAKCHHGHLYYNTKRIERHPGLPKGFDLLRRQVDALHHEGIRAPIYISIQCDQYAAITHPEWVCVNPDKTYVTWAKDVFGAGWQILDEVDGKVPVFAGTGHYSTATTIKLSQHDKSHGATGLLLITPYFLRPPRSAVLDHFRAVHRAVVAASSRDIAQEPAKKQPKIRY